MGITATKQRVSHHFHKSQEFTTSCATVFSDLQDLTQHTSPDHIFAYQLPDAATRLHSSLSLSVPLVSTWCPHPPPRSQVDATFRSLPRTSEDSLDSDEFKEFAVALFADAVVSNASKKVASRVGVGVAGIAGVGMLARVGGGVVGSLIGVYALGVATSVFLSLG